jgi:hypothetical protein
MVAGIIVAGIIVAGIAGLSEEAGQRGDGRWEIM